MALSPSKMSASAFAVTVHCALTLALVENVGPTIPNFGQAGVKLVSKPPSRDQVAPVSLPSTCADVRHDLPVEAKSQLALTAKSSASGSPSRL